MSSQVTSEGPARGALGRFRGRGERYVARLADAQSERGDDVFVIGGDTREMRRETPLRVGHVPAATVARTTLAIVGRSRAPGPMSCTST